MSTLRGKTCVLTGVFPEVGGGVGLDVGKAKIKTMIQLLGGWVRGSISTKTDILVVGQEPGFSKVSKARAQPNCRLLPLRDLNLKNGHIKKAEGHTMIITRFSNGYHGNGLAKRVSSTEYFIVAGTETETIPFE